MYILRMTANIKYALYRYIVCACVRTCARVGSCVCTIVSVYVCYCLCAHLRFIHIINVYIKLHIMFLNIYVK